MPLALSKPFIPGWYDLGPFVAECWLIGTLIAVLLVPFVRRRANLACAAVAVLGMGGALVSMLIVGVPVTDAGKPPLGGILIMDPFALMWKALLLMTAIAVVLLWLATSAAQVKEGDGPEFFVLVVGATLGMALMASTTNLLMLFMAVELASLPSYVLAGFRKTHRPGAEAALKYVLFGAACSAIMVFGLTYLYGMFGTLDLGTIAQRVTAGEGSAALLTVAVTGIIVGVGAKVSAAPLHFWCPDVFEGAGVEVAAFLSVASKGAALALLLRVALTLADAVGFVATPGTTALAIGLGSMGVLTMTWGNTAALAQTNVKRLLAYSSIAHAGYMLCALSLLIGRPGAAPVDALTGTSAAAQALLFYLAVYVFMNVGAFAAAGVVARATGSEDLSALAGLGRRSPVLAASMLLCLLSLIGLPPLAGFMAKVNLWVALAASGGWWWWLVAAIAVNTVVSLAYYARVIKVMYLEGAVGGAGGQAGAGGQGSAAGTAAFSGHPIGTALAVGSAGVLVLMFVLTGPLGRLMTDYAKLRGVGGGGV
ncbi:MAG: NADH-quinone oxidoreductase subunit N, partial [Phycisphaerae bacterium]